MPSTAVCGYPRNTGTSRPESTSAAAWCPAVGHHLAIRLQSLEIKCGPRIWHTHDYNVVREAYLNAQLIWHRDLKPPNVLIAVLPSTSTRGLFKITDFGLSTQKSERDALSVTVAGTVGPPEHVQRRSLS